MSNHKAMEEWWARHYGGYLQWSYHHGPIVVAKWDIKGNFWCIHFTMPSQNRLYHTSSSHLPPDGMVQITATVLHCLCNNLQCGTGAVGQQHLFRTTSNWNSDLTASSAVMCKPLANLLKVYRDICLVWYKHHQWPNSKNSCEQS